MDPAYQLDETFAWFLPGKKGEHDLKFGTNFVYTPLHIFDVSNLNGTFTFSSTDLDFNAANPRTYPDRLSIRVPGASDFVVNGTFLGLFAQDKWKVNNRVTASIGLRYDLEVLPLKEKDNPKFSSEDAYPVDKNNVSPRIGLTVGLNDAGTSVVRGGWGLFYQKTPFTFVTGVVSAGVFSDSFTAQLCGPATAPICPSATQVDPGPSAGRLPTSPFLVNGPVVNRALLNSLFPPGTLAKNTGTVQFDNPDRHLPYSRQASVGFERQLSTAIAVSADYIRTELRDLYMRARPEPDDTRFHGAHRGRDPAGPEFCRLRAGDWQLRLGQYGLPAGEPEQALHPRLPVPCRVHAVEVVRQHRQPREHRDDHDPGRRRSESGSRVKRGPPRIVRTCSRWAARSKCRARAGSS